MTPMLFAVPFVLSLVVSLAVTYLTISIYTKLGIVDRSSKKDHPKHIHERPIPRGGGIPIVVAMLFTALLSGQTDTHMTAILIGALIITVAGVLDDILDLSPYLRLVLGLAASSVVVYAGLYISFVSNPLGEGVITLSGLTAQVVAVLWITWCMNFVNMGAKGLDGQLPGVVVIAACVMGLLSYRFVNDVTAWPSTMMAFALAGAYAGLLVFNVYPQRIMPGWGGGALAGYYLAVLSMLSGAKVATALIVLGVPLMDVVYAIIRRVMQGKSPVWGDDKHLHHKLLAIGWSKRKIAGFYWLVTALLGLLALNLNSQYKAYTIVLTAVVVGGVLLWINLFLSQKRQELHSGSKT